MDDPNVALGALAVFVLGCGDGFGYAIINRNGMALAACIAAIVGLWLLLTPNPSDELDDC